MIIGVLCVSICIPDARSLKDKRAVLRSLKDRTVHRMNVSVAETGKQDVWKSAELAFVTVGAETAIVESRLSKLSEMVRGDPRYVVTDLHTEMI